MDGVDLKQAVLNKGKQMASVAASAANGNGGKKRRKGTDLKPIVTNDANPADPTESYVKTSASLSLRFLVAQSRSDKCYGVLTPLCALLPPCIYLTSLPMPKLIAFF